MQYIHDSVLGSHGHLSSSNCVIDSRWACKITDYGMGLFKQSAPVVHDKKSVAEFPVIDAKSSAGRSKQVSTHLLNLLGNTFMYFIY